MRPASQRHRLAFLMPIALGAGVLAASGSMAAHLLTPAGWNGLEKTLGQSCAGLSAFIVNGLKSPHLLAAALTLFVFAAFAVSFARQTLATRRYLRSLHPAGETKTPALESALKELGLPPRRVCVIETDAALCFSAGFVEPKIYISDRALRRLSGAELLAVLAHEKNHLETRDPLRSAVLKALSRAFFFLPVMRSLETRHAEAKEVAADEAALKMTGGKLALAEALFKLTGASPSVSSGVAAAGLAFFAQRSLFNIRISLIAGERYIPAPLAVSKIVLSLAMAAALLTALVPRASAETPAPDCASQASTPATVMEKSPLFQKTAVPAYAAPR